ncbi:SDR family oxidoreductase [Microbacterium deminutum]|uniref:NAD(P)H-binding protein n=1 Tax=Microbacterium deminutum TaxID=344164 RepID=A0ABP5CB22_9MICO
MRIAVAGGTGLTGRHVVEIARRRGHDAVPLSRYGGVDLVSGAGLPQALVGADTVIDVSNIGSIKTDVAVSFFAGATRNLLATERKVGVTHHIALSIVGVDAAPEGYYAGKLSQERIIEAGDIPWTIQRATQFHEFAALMFDTAKAGPMHLAPRARTQPIAVREVAEHLVTLAEDGPGGRVRELAGPREESLADMVRSYARAIGHRGWIPEVSLPGALGRAQRNGSLLPQNDPILGRQTFAEWLAALPDG